MGKAVRSDTPHPGAVDRPATRGGGNRISRKGYRISQGDGGSWTLRTALSEVRRKDSADSLCGKRNELLRSLPDRRQSSRRSWFVPLVAIGLAADARRARSPQEPLKPTDRTKIGAI